MCAHCPHSHTFWPCYCTGNPKRKLHFPYLHSHEGPRDQRFVMCFCLCKRTGHIAIHFGLHVDCPHGPFQTWADDKVYITWKLAAMTARKLSFVLQVNTVNTQLITISIVIIINKHIHFASFISLLLLIKNCSLSTTFWDTVKHRFFSDRIIISEAALYVHCPHRKTRLDNKLDEQR